MTFEAGTCIRLPGPQRTKRGRKIKQAI